MVPVRISRPQGLGVHVWSWSNTGQSLARRVLLHSLVLTGSRWVKV